MTTAASVAKALAGHHYNPDVAADKGEARQLIFAYRVRLCAAAPSVEMAMSARAAVGVATRASDAEDAAACALLYGTLSLTCVGSSHDTVVGEDNGRDAYLQLRRDVDADPATSAGRRAVLLDMSSLAWARAGSASLLKRQVRSVAIRIADTHALTLPALLARTADDSGSHGTDLRDLLGAVVAAIGPDLAPPAFGLCHSSLVAGDNSLGDVVFVLDCGAPGSQTYRNGPMCW